MSSNSRSAMAKAFKYLRQSSRICPKNVRDNPGAYTKGGVVASKHNKAGQGHRELQSAAKPPLGWIYGDYYCSWFQRFPSDRTYNKDMHLKREYPPMSLLELQRLIDLGYLDVSKPIDLTTLCNTMQYICDPRQRQYGVQLTDQGSEVFRAKVNIEVQWASEMTIAAVERNGGVITTAYYDPISLDAIADPMKFFSKGEPIPKRMFPPVDCVDYYIDEKSRGYLSNPVKLAAARFELAQKYGYKPVDITQDALYKDLLSVRKDPLQIFVGLEPGWVVNLRDKCVLKPTDEELKNYYNTFAHIRPPIKATAAQ